LIEKRANRGGVASAIAMAALLLLVKLVAFVREIIVAAAYGASEVTDAFFVANSLPTMIFALASAGLTAIFIPAYTQLRQKRGEAAAELFTNQIMNVAIIAFFALAALLGLFAPALIRLLAPGFLASAEDLAVRALRVIIFTLPLQVMMGVMVNLLIANSRFAASQLYGLPMSVSVIVFVALLADRWSVNALAYGTLLGAALQFALMRVMAGGLYTWRPALQLRGLNTGRRLAALAGVAVLSGAPLEMTSLVENFMASGLPAQSISQIDYAYRLISIVSGIVVVTMVTIAYQRFANDASQDNLRRLNDRLSGLLKTMFFVLAPLIALLIILAEPAVAFVYERGEFTHNITHSTSLLLVCYAPALMGIAIRELAGRAFFACGDMKRPMMVNMGALAANALFSGLLLRPLGAIGIVMGSTLALLLSGLVLWMLWTKRCPEKRAHDYREYGKIALATAFCAICALVMRGYWGNLTPLRTLVYIGCGALTSYALALWLLRSVTLRAVVIQLGRQARRFLSEKLG